MDLAWSLFVNSALDLYQPFRAESSGFCLSVKHSFQEQTSPSKAPAPHLTFPSHLSDLDTHKGLTFSGSVSPWSFTDLLWVSYTHGTRSWLSCFPVDSLIRCMGESGSTTIGSSAPGNSGSHAKLWPCTAQEERMHLSKTLVPCAQRKQPCTRYFSSFQKNFDFSRVCLPLLSVPKKLGGDISLEKNQDWDTGQVLRLWLWDADDGNISVTPESLSLGSDIAGAHLSVIPSHNPFVGHRVLIFSLLTFRDWKHILRLSTLSVMFSKMFFMEYFCSTCWSTLNSSLFEENGDYSIFLSRKVKSFLLWFLGFWKSGLPRELVGNRTPKFLPALANPAVDTRAHFLICDEQALTLWTQEYEFIYACECFCLHVFDHSQRKTETV